MKATIRKPNKEELEFMKTCETWEHEAGFLIGITKKNKKHALSSKVKDL